MNEATCKEGCYCASDCGSDDICIARCQSTYNGYIIEPVGVLDEADALAECQYGDLPFGGLGVDDACDEVEDDFPGVNCTVCTKIELEGDEETCATQIRGLDQLNICECPEEEDLCQVLGPFCQDEGPFLDPPCDRSGGSDGDPHFKTWCVRCCRWNAVFCLPSSCLPRSLITHTSHILYCINFCIVQGWKMV